MVYMLDRSYNHNLTRKDRFYTEDYFAYVIKRNISFSGSRKIPILPSPEYPLSEFLVSIS